MSIHSDNHGADTQKASAGTDPDQLVAQDLNLPANIQVIRPLGHGSMATVILARDTTLKRLVAIKLLRKELSADPTCQRRFEREAQAAARLSHDCVTTVYSVGRLDNNEPYIVMQ